MSDTVEDRTRKVVAEVFGLPLSDVTLDTSQQTVENWDSLNLLNVLMAIEAEFGVSVSPEEASEFVSVNRIVGVVKRKGL